MKNRDERAVLIQLLQSYPEKNPKELKWLLMDCGIYLNEEQVDFLANAPSHCKCFDSGGDCRYCQAYYLVGDQ